MTAWSAQPRQPLAARAFDTERPGSAGSQLLLAAVSFGLAIALVVGQVSLAIEKGLARNLHANVAQIKDGNETMAQIIKKAEPSKVMDTIVAGQATTQQRTQETLIVLNGQMVVVSDTTDQLAGTVGHMEASSDKLSTTVGGLASDSELMAALLGGLPLTTTRTHKQLKRIGDDTADINTELGHVGDKLNRYGLPQAQGVQKR